MFRRLLIAVLLVIGFTNNVAAEPKLTDVSDWANTQIAPSLELRMPLGGEFMGTFNGIHFITPQSGGELNFLYFGFEHQTTPTLWISPQVGMVTSWTEHENAVLAFWSGWDFHPQWELSTDTEVIVGAGLSDYFGHYQLNCRTAFGKIGLHFEQVNDSQQVGPHVQFKHDGLKLNLGVYAGSGSANGRIGIAYALPL